MSPSAGSISCDRHPSDIQVWLNLEPVTEALCTVIIVFCWPTHIQILGYSRGEHAITYNMCLFISCCHPLPPWIPCRMAGLTLEDDSIQHPTLECRLDGSMGHILLEDDIPPRVIIRWFLLQESSRWQIVFENNAVCLEQTILCFLGGQQRGWQGAVGGLHTSSSGAGFASRLVRGYRRAPLELLCISFYPQPCLLKWDHVKHKLSLELRRSC